MATLRSATDARSWSITLHAGGIASWPSICRAARVVSDGIDEKMRTLRPPIPSHARRRCAASSSPTGAEAMAVVRRASRGHVQPCPSCRFLGWDIAFLPKRRRSASSSATGGRAWRYRWPTAAVSITNWTRCAKSSEQRAQAAGVHPPAVFVLRRGPRAPAFPGSAPLCAHAVFHTRRGCKCRISLAPPDSSRTSARRSTANGNACARQSGNLTASAPSPASTRRGSATARLTRPSAATCGSIFTSSFIKERGKLAIRSSPRGGGTVSSTASATMRRATAPRRATRYSSTCSLASSSAANGSIPPPSRRRNSPPL